MIISGGCILAAIIFQWLYYREPEIPIHRQREAQQAFLSGNSFFEQGDIATAVMMYRSGSTHWLSYAFPFLCVVLTKGLPQRLLRTHTMLTRGATSATLSVPRYSIALNGGRLCMRRQSGHTKQPLQ